MKNLNRLMKKNQDWAKKMVQTDTDYFSRSAIQQAPEILWIGCADSRVPPNHILDLPPGEIFVHRNIANIVNPSDPNCVAVIQYAVTVLKVKHIIVCGHYGCGGVLATLENNASGVVDQWLYELKVVKIAHADHLAELSTQDKAARLSELNVLKQTENLKKVTYVNDAMETPQLTIHSWIYDLNTGLLKNLTVDN